MNPKWRLGWKAGHLLRAVPVYRVVMWQGVALQERGRNGQKRGHPLGCKDLEFWDGTGVERRPETRFTDKSLEFHGWKAWASEEPPSSFGEDGEKRSNVVNGDNRKLPTCVRGREGAMCPGGATFQLRKSGGHDSFKRRTWLMEGFCCSHRLKPDWVLRRDNVEEIITPLKALQMVMDTLSLPY